MEGNHIREESGNSNSLTVWGFLLVLCGVKGQTEVAISIKLLDVMVHFHFFYFVLWGIGYIPSEMTFNFVELNVK